MVTNSDLVSLMDEYQAILEQLQGINDQELKTKLTHELTMLNKRIDALQQSQEKQASKKKACIEDYIAARSQQDMLHKRLIKLSNGSYIPATHLRRFSTFYNGKWVQMSQSQKRITEGLIVLDNGVCATIDAMGAIKAGKAQDCFIATAVYKDPNALEVNVLREFKEQKLRKTMPGRMFIYFYYSGFGRITANVITNLVPSTIPILKKGLDYLVKRQLYNQPANPPKQGNDRVQN